MKNNWLVTAATDKPKWFLFGVLVLTLLTGALIPQIKVDTDPENMLPADQADRVIHNQIKKTFDLSDMIVVGIVDHTHEHGVFNERTLANIHALARSIETIDGVIDKDLMSLAHVDNVTQQDGALRFEWMMPTPPTSSEQALYIRDAVKRLPLLNNTLVSGDGQAAGIYVPIVEKHESHRIAGEIKAFIDQLPPSQAQYHITGLPVAEDTFGVEMFVQMAISAPLAGLAIFALMWFFFRSVTLITAPMLMAMAVVVITMGSLIGAGFTVHIMSSMIPIFLMPIAVVDSVHVLSEFSDRYRPGDNAKTVMRGVMGHLFTPMLYTSITSSIGFASLALTPIPPVQVFGAFVALGIILAFLFTITFIPAYVVSLSPARLEKLAAATARHHDESAVHAGPLTRLLRANGRFSVANSKLLALGFTVVFGISLVGIQKIQINDNPVRWFEQSHPIRVADKVLNEHFAGTYNAFMTLRWDGASLAILDQRIAEHLPESSPVYAQWQALRDDVDTSVSITEQMQALQFAVDDFLFSADDDTLAHWEIVADQISEALADSRYFQTPEALHYIADMQTALQQSGYVGKSNTLADAVKTVYRELTGGDMANHVIPDSRDAVAQSLLSYQSSHRPHDLWHMVTPDFQSSVLWLQLKSGDNKDMENVLAFVDEYVAQHPLPDQVNMEWGGLTYINVIWQDAMVKGMGSALIGSFITVFVLMVVLFRSVLFGLMAMLPLTITISFIYGLIGYVGKDYDMPVAVLSALTLGLSIDFAIHFLERARAEYRRLGDWKETMAIMSEEPARAISRNAIVIAIGFTPLLLAPLVPYQTVGLFLATIMAVSCIVSMMMLPAAMTLLLKWIK